MQKNFTRLITHFLSAKRYTVPAGALLLFLVTSIYLQAAIGIIVTGGSSITISADKAANATLTTPTYTSIGPINFREGGDDDFGTVTKTIEINAPTGWQFYATAPHGVSVVGREVSNNSKLITTSLTVTNSKITITYSGATSNKQEEIILSGAQVIAVSGVSAPETVNITAGGTLFPTAVNILQISHTEGAARKLAFITQPGGALTNEALNPQPVVAIQDQFGNTVTTASNTVTLTRASNSSLTGVLTPGTATSTNGVVTFTGASINTAGTGYQLVASSNGLTSVTSAAFTVNNRQPVITAVSGCLSVGDPETTVTITGENFVSGATVSFGGVSASSVTVNNATTITAVLPASAFTTAGDKNVVVTNPLPASINGVSGAFTKQVRALFHFRSKGQISSVPVH